MDLDNAFEMAPSSIRYGKSVTEEIGADLKDRGIKSVLFVTDPILIDLHPVKIALKGLNDEGVDVILFDKVRVEPSDQSFKEAIAFASSKQFDAVVAVGGGSSIDTAKAALLYSTFPPDDFLDYVNPPIGKGKPIPGQLKPLFAVPTTAGTGSEITGVSIFDYIEKKVKTGISNRLLKPTLGIVDPENTRTMPPLVAASTGLDVFCHAIESYTAIPYDRRPKPERPKLRPPYQGSNPISDVWSLKSMEMVGEYLPKVYKNPGDEEARSQMLLAASYAGLGFGNAGVHYPHAMSYPVASKVKEYTPPDYTIDHPMIPHGISVLLNAPAVFRFTASACPERHLKAAETLGADISGATNEDAGRILADRVIDYMKILDLPNGLSAVGYDESDIPDLVQGTLAQQRLTKMSPRQADEQQLADMFKDALSYW